ncbi:MAG: NADH-quinone oxidoreductase subunit NuoE [Alphaproteobacteria bacterium]|nr:NADH-quinone oxidoreductase subunit NuoE [Alphaproteobacteria bacterium]
MSEQDFQPATFAFTEANKALAQAAIAKYPRGRQRSAVMPLLDLAQRQEGWVSKAAMDHVAAMLSMPPIRVYEVATFYSMFQLKPVGEHHVQVCTNLPCWLRGSDEVAHACKKTLGVDFGETTADGRFTLSEVECLGACVNAPMMQIGDDYYEDLDAESAARILDTIKRGERPKPGPQIDRQFSAPVGGPTTLGDIESKGKQ